MTVTERKIERDWRARRAEYLAETGRTEPKPDRILSGHPRSRAIFAGPEFPERQRRARDLVAALERRAFGRQLGTGPETASRRCGRDRGAELARAGRA